MKQRDSKLKSAPYFGCIYISIVYTADNSSANERSASEEALFDISQLRDEGDEGDEDGEQKMGDGELVLSLCN